MTVNENDAEVHPAQKGTATRLATVVSGLVGGLVLLLLLRDVKVLGGSAIYIALTCLSVSVVVSTYFAAKKRIYGPKRAAFITVLGLLNIVIFIYLFWDETSHTTNL